MTYIVSEDTKISEKWIQLISRMTECGYKGAVKQPVSLSVLDRQTDFSHFSHPVCLSVLDSQTDLYNN